MKEYLKQIQFNISEFFYFKSPLNTVAFAIFANIALVIANLFPLSSLEVISISNENLIIIIENILPTYAGIFGISISILSLFISIIQISKNEISLLELVFKTSYLIFTFSFGIINIIILIVAYILLKNDDPKFLNQIQSIAYSCTIGLILFCFLLCKTFIQIYNFSIERKLIKSYLDDIKKLLLLEKNVPQKTELSQILISKSTELDNELNRCIGSDNTQISSLILDFFLHSIKSFPTSKVNNAIKTKLGNWIYLSFDQQKNQTLSLLVGFWSKELQYNNKFNTLSNLTSSLYRLARKYKNENFQSYIIEVFPIRIKEIIIIHLWDFKNDEEFENLLNKIIPLITEFSELFHLIIENQNFKNLETLMNEFNLLEESLNPNIYLITKRFSKENLESITLNIFYVKFINLAWLYFMFSKERNLTESSLESIRILEENLKIQKSDFIKFSSIILINRKYHKIDEWIWNSEVRISGKTYFLDTEEEIISLGILVIIVKMNIEYEDFDLINTHEDENINNLIFYCNKQFNKYEKDQNFWNTLLNTNAERTYDSKKIRTLFENLKTKQELKHDNSIIDEELSEKLINEFKNKIESQWSNNKTLEKVFEFNETETVNLDKEKFSVKSDITPQVVEFKKGKILFVEKNFQNVYGIESGVNLCINTNNKFKEFILENVTPIVKNNLLEILSSISRANKNGKNINTVFISYSDWYLNEMDIINSGNFIKREDYPNEFPYDYFGLFDEQIQIIPLSYYETESVIIALNCKDAIVLNRHLDSKWYNSILEIEVKEITEKVLKEQLKEDVGKLDSKEIAKRRTGVLLMIGYYLKFTLKNIEKVKVYKIK